VCLCARPLFSCIASATSVQRRALLGVAAFRLRRMLYPFLFFGNLFTDSGNKIQRNAPYIVLAIEYGQIITNRVCVASECITLY
jgi:hypothetical protein